MRDVHEFDDGDQPDTPRWAVHLRRACTYSVPIVAPLLAVLVDHVIATVGVVVYMLTAFAVLARRRWWA